MLGGDGGGHSYRHIHYGEAPTLCTTPIYTHAPQYYFSTHSTQGHKHRCISPPSVPYSEPAYIPIPTNTYHTPPTAIYSATSPKGTHPGVGIAGGLDALRFTTMHSPAMPAHSNGPPCASASGHPCIMCPMHCHPSSTVARGCLRGRLWCCLWRCTRVKCALLFVPPPPCAGRCLWGRLWCCLWHRTHVKFVLPFATPPLCRALPVGPPLAHPLALPMGTPSSTFIGSKCWVQAPEHSE